MGGMSWIHWLLLAGVVLILFGGRGKISDLMGDFGKGITSFKKGLSERAELDELRSKDANQDKTTV